MTSQESSDSYKGKMFKSGERIIYIPENREYEFGYYSQTTGRIVIYEIGCCNMQDSYAVDLCKIRRRNY